MKRGPFLVNALILLLGSLALAWGARAQSGAGAEPASSRDYHFTIASTQAWTDTGLDLQPGELLEIKAAPVASAGSGSTQAASAPASCDPQGQRAAAGNQALPVTSAPPGALIAKLQAQGPASLVGAGKDLRATSAGHLFLGVNAEGTPPCAGSFSVTVHVVSGQNPAPAASANPQSSAATPSSAPPAAGQSQAPAPNVKQKLATAAQTWLSGQFGASPAAAASSSAAAPGAAAVPANSALASPGPALTVSSVPLDAALRTNINSLPRRVNDEYNNLGDMVNFVLVGSQQQVQSALDAANWHLADTDVKKSAITAVVETYEKKDYLQMPMSQLRLFGRVQDFGYEQAEAYSVVASRHHFRLWKAPFSWNGQNVWVGAGTHDIGFEKDQRNGKVTHKIDPAVDGERDNIGGSLQKSGKVKSMSYYLPPDPVQETKNATGGGYHSDGRLLVVFVQ